jgi:hypothetical protein
MSQGWARVYACGCRCYHGPVEEKFGVRQGSWVLSGVVAGGGGAVGGGSVGARSELRRILRV